MENAIWRWRWPAFELTGGLKYFKSPENTSRYCVKLWKILRHNWAGAHHWDEEILQLTNYLPKWTLREELATEALCTAQNSADTCARQLESSEWASNCFFCHNGHKELWSEEIFEGIFHISAKELDYIYPCLDMGFPTLKACNFRLSSIPGWGDS